LLTHVHRLPKRLLANDLNEHISKRVNKNLQSDSSGEYDMGDDGNLDELVEQFQASRELDGEEFDEEYIDLQRYMGPLVNTITDAMTTGGSDVNTELVRAACAVCSHTAGDDKTELSLSHGPHVKWTACLTRPHDLQGGLTDQLRLDLDGIVLEQTIRCQWQSLLFDGHRSRRSLAAVYCCSQCQTALQQGTVPRFAIANNLQPCMTHDPCSGVNGGVLGQNADSSSQIDMALPMLFEQMDAAFDNVKHC